jgi:putative lipoic acid-binding regulatory protein
MVSRSQQIPVVQALLTVTIEALSKAQLDRIYEDLSNCDQVLLAL